MMNEAPASSERMRHDAESEGMMAP